MKIYEIQADEKIRTEKHYFRVLVIELEVTTVCISIENCTN